VINQGLRPDLPNQQEGCSTDFALRFLRSRLRLRLIECDRLFFLFLFSTLFLRLSSPEFDDDEEDDEDEEEEEDDGVNEMETDCLQYLSPI
jgi:hypothetical protein